MPRHILTRSKLCLSTMLTLLVLSVILALAPASRTAAQEAGLTDLYGHGVHAYFSGQNSLALQHFNEAINAGTRDPRSYYYRGLVWLRLYMENEAKADFARGAELEMGDAAGLFNVDFSLQRIQGRTRMMIERERMAARTAALRALSEERVQYREQIDAARPEVTTPVRPLPPRRAVPREAPPDPVPPAEQDPLGAPPADPDAGAAAPAEPAPARPNPFAPTDPLAAPGAAPPANAENNERRPPPPADDSRATPPAEAAPPQQRAQPQVEEEPVPVQPPAASDQPRQTSTTSGQSTRALGNVLRKTFGGLLPSVPINVGVMRPQNGDNPPATSQLPKPADN